MPLLIINDIDECIASKILKFTDDTKVYHIVNSTKDCEILLSDLHKLVAWSTDWQTLFNTEKCKVMHLGFNNPQTEYDMNGVTMQMVKDEKDLSVIVSADMKWERQCIEVVKKANKMLGLIKRNFQDRSKDTIVPLYKSLVRPHQEYCCQVWCHILKKDIKLIEGVQQRATKLTEDVKYLSYDERFMRLGLTHLDKRRVRSDLLETFRIVHSIDKIDEELFFEFDSGGRRGHSCKLFKKCTMLDIRKFAFSNQSVNTWNALSQDNVNCTTINAFKRHIQNELELGTQL